MEIIAVYIDRRTFFATYVVGFLTSRQYCDYLPSVLYVDPFPLIAIPYLVLPIWLKRLSSKRQHVLSYPLDEVKS